MSSVRKSERLLLELASCLGIRLIVHPSESGRRWVEECKFHFGRACGSDFVRDVSDKQKPYDLVVCGKKVQCKYRSRNKGDVVKIRNSHRASGGWYANEEVDFFAIAYETQHFVVPYKSLVRSDGTFLNDMNVSRLRSFQDGWDIQGDAKTVFHGGLFNDENFFPSM